LICSCFKLTSTNYGGPYYVGQWHGNNPICKFGSMQPLPDTDWGHSQRGLFNYYWLLIELVFGHWWFHKETVTSPWEGGIKLGHMHVLCLKAFLYWLKNLSRCGINLYNKWEDFGQYKLKECIKVLEAYKDMDKFKDSKTTALDKFQLHSLHGWTQFNWDLQNYLASIQSIAGVPLSYIIWKEEFLDIAPPGEDGVEELICLAPLYGTPYLEDKKRVYCIIRDAVSRTNGWTWMQDVQNEDGKQAMKCLHDHYDGPRAKTHCIQDAKEQLKICAYKNETTFQFKHYVSVLKECLLHSKKTKGP